MLEDIKMGKFTTFYRTRAMLSMENPITKEFKNKLCLNEIFAAEKDVAMTSTFRLAVDGKETGKFKSSGILISTGTGSTGWLYSAKQISYHDIQTIQRFFGTGDEHGNIAEEMTKQINSQNVFPIDEESLYYFVKEGYTNDPSSYLWRAEGFC